jgi:hypothetical protein
MPWVVALGVILMRGFAGLLAYLAGVSAIFSIGIVGLMALQSPTERLPLSPTVATASDKGHLAKPVKQPTDGEKTANKIQRHKKVHISRKQRRDDAGRSAYGYAEEHRIDPNEHFFFGR